ncbi:hypothetical protein WQ54_03330 [Bacillus sp. SA1-12]|uniref:hypothetical protein n=1 Tax=Bacillus sp. SA1-12 TaxID=1455638 RepID=UPI0006268D28|nr:hypothetical protein [Bacillus sp. SA1-12]KKI93652.1 hypothetical protein WQ54_03330 [Bacillus sp. SA1-12]
MAKLLDARTSQGASYANSISVPVTTTAQLFGRLTLNAAGGTGLIRTQISGTVAIQLPDLPVVTTITITVVRQSSSSNPSVLIYSVEETLDTSILGPQVLSFTASDFNVPPSFDNRIAYLAFISADTGGATRVGPESFNATIYSD